ncbi:MAG: hypothetical protein H6733_00990 [Alphaproteobacteria bacterium]|nr:hypothetical protein [Alphaproteobacteria bacterium]
MHARPCPTRGARLGVATTLLLGGCQLLGVDAPATDAVDATAADQLPAPGAYGLTLDVDGVLLPGATLQFTVTGAAPGQTVVVLVGAEIHEDAACPSFLQGLCADVTGPGANPFAVRRTTADANGRVAFSLTVPASLQAPSDWFFQAAALQAGAATSPVVPKFKPAPTGTEYPVVSSSGVVSPSGFLGTYRLSYVGSTFDLDRCTYEATATGVPTTTAATCVGCDFAFDVRLTSWHDGSVAGDCVDLGYDNPNTLPPGFLIRVGYDADYVVPAYGAMPQLMIYEEGAWVATGWVPELDGSTWTWGVNYGALGQVYVY